MKLAFFDDFSLGIVRGDMIVDVTHLLEDLPCRSPQDLISAVIADFGTYRERFEATASSDGVPLDSVRVRPPVPKPENIICMAVNYLENGRRKEFPTINAFTKPASSVIGDGDQMVLPDLPAKVFEGEAEIAVVFGKEARNVPEEDAFDYLFGYTNFIDGSARGLGPERNIYYAMKSHDTFAPIGPFLVTKDEIEDPQNVQVRLWNNGELRQDYNTDDMAYPISTCVAWVTSIHTMYPGDILAMGTNHAGLHAFMEGDRIEMEVEGLGKLRFSIRDDLKRTWTRETHLERELAGHKGIRNQIAPQLTGKYAEN